MLGNVQTEMLHRVRCNFTVSIERKKNAQGFYRIPLSLHVYRAILDFRHFFDWREGEEGGTPPPPVYIHSFSFLSQFARIKIGTGFDFSPWLWKILSLLWNVFLVSTMFAVIIERLRGEMTQMHFFPNTKWITENFILHMYIEIYFVDI